eukprot:SAG31_NODE_32_length_32319_cov_28.042681_21_plen_77_part_00
MAAHLSRDLGAQHGLPIDGAFRREVLEHALLGTEGVPVLARGGGALEHGAEQRHGSLATGGHLLFATVSVRDRGNS